MTTAASRAARVSRRALVVAAACAAVGAAAQPYPTPPSPAPPRPLAIDAPSEGKLGNGLRVIVARREGVPIVSAELVALSGAELDPPRLSGLASLAASLMTQGTKRHSAPELAAAAEALGGSLDSGAGWNSATVSITVTTPKLDAALGLVAEVAREPVFAPDEIDRVRTQTLDELKVAYASPGTLASLVAERLAYGAGSYGHPAEGTPESLPRITRDNLVSVHRRTFRPDNAVLILAGDINLETALALARRHFGSWPVPSDPAPPVPRPSGATSGPPAAIVDMANSGQAAVVIALAAGPIRQRARDRHRPQLGARRRLLVASQSGDSHQARSQLRREQRPRCASRSGVLSRRRADQERIGGRGRPPRAGRDRPPDEGPGRQRRARRAQGRADRRLLAQR